MAKVLIAVQGTLECDGAQDIALRVESISPPQVSPIVVIENGAGRVMTGDYDSLLKAFKEAAEEHPEYSVKEYKLMYE